MITKSESNATYYQKNRKRLLAYFKERRQIGLIDTDPVTQDLPKTYGDCSKMRKLYGGVCPHVGCKWHVFTLLPVPTKGQINQEELNDDKVLDKLFENETCILRAIESGVDAPEGIGTLMWMSKERVRQIEKKALRRMKHCVRREALR